MSKIVAIFGGTFSPPHLGHVHAAEVFSQHLHPDQLLIVPTYMPPHKQQQDMVSAEDRLEMCRLAFSHIENAEVSDIEIARGGFSYTADTLEVLAAQDRKLAFLCGTDMMLTLDRWYAPEKIFSLCDIYCIRRESSNDMQPKIDEANARYLEKFGKMVHIIGADEIVVSSSEIREALLQGKRHPLLTDAVANYIAERGLYR